MEGVRQLLWMLLNGQPIDPLMFLGTAFTIYPNTYGFFMTFNYINDRYYRMWYTQLFFSVTELVCACCCFLLMSATATSSSSGQRPKQATAFLAWTALTISIIHFFQSLIDQGLMNLSVGERHQRSRDLGFVICDVGVIACTLLFLARFYRQEGAPLAFVRQHAWEALKYGAVLWIGFQFIP